MNTTLEIPEGSKATIQGKVIDGKNYLVVEVEQESELKEGDIRVLTTDGRLFSLLRLRLPITFCRLALLPHKCLIEILNLKLCKKLN